MEKQGLRRAMLERRRAVPPSERVCVSRTICERLLARDDVDAAISSGRPIAVYLASADEIDLDGFITAALARGAKLVAPRWTGETYDLASLLSLEDVVLGPHGIREPAGALSSVGCEAVAVWLVPGLAFTRGGMRLGYGGGWYDRFLSHAAPQAVSIGVGYGFQVVDDLPAEDHDRLLCAVEMA